ncbi:MAG TPA: 4-alpha-glucanotransferase [Planctomycetaceae bacterium]|nr:4-alpha-glucanotransferase [Planctomycetaceae bacterium]
MLSHRASGVLLHPTSIPTAYGIGDLGPDAFAWVDWLADAGQKYWQVLPLVPTDSGDSPYQSPSVFAGNPWLISPDLLVRDGLLTEEEITAAKAGVDVREKRVRFADAGERKNGLLELAANRLQALPSSDPLQQEFQAFCAAERDWLEPHAEFMTLREINSGRWWLEWTIDVTPERRLTDAGREQHASRLTAHRLWQFVFFRQWDALRAHARSRGVQIIGDVPIYVAHDSADVWANRAWFLLDDTGRSTRVAGVPPDYFSETGQLWSNPLYDWDALQRDGYRWWIARMRAALRLVDLVRLDHFRGFESYWSIPAGEETAVSGEWIPGPRDAFLSVLQESLRDNEGQLPIIAEDLGMITEAVHEFRKRFGLPGMNVLHFRLPGAPHEPRFRLDEFDVNSVIYTGTHDNDTTRGWFEAEILPYPERLQQLKEFTPCDPDNIAWEFIELAWKSSSALAIAPLQDVLSLDHSARMNTPGTAFGDYANWQWKYSPGMLTADIAARLRELTVSTGR